MYVVLFLLSTSTLRHPNLVALVGVVDDLPTPFIVTEYMAKVCTVLLFLSSRYPL